MTLFPDGHTSGMLVKAPIDAVVSCLVDWGNEEVVGRRTKAKKYHLPLTEAWKLLGERTHTPDHAIVVPINSAYTAFFDNQSREWLASAELYVLSKRLATDTYFFSLDSEPTPDRLRGASYNANQFLGGEVIKRQVMVCQDGAWTFNEFGTPLPFENIEAYKCSKKRDRLTADLLHQYGESLGLPFWDPEAYGHDVVLLEWGDGQQLDEETAIKKVLGIFDRANIKGRPKWIMSKKGIRKPPA